MTALHVAVKGKRAAHVERLLAAGASVHEVDKGNRTPLFLAVDKDSPEVNASPHIALSTWSIVSGTQVSRCTQFTAKTI